jgi:hypothetical protein
MLNARFSALSFFDNASDGTTGRAAAKLVVRDDVHEAR